LIRFSDILVPATIVSCVIDVAVGEQSSLEGICPNAQTNSFQNISNYTKIFLFYQ